MKKSIKIFAVALAVVMLCLSLASCDLFGKKLNGKYVNDGGLLGGETTFEFKGDNVEVSHKSALTGRVESQEGKYKIEDDEITFTFYTEDGDEIENAPYSGSWTFEEDDDGDVIHIGTELFVKVDR